MSTMAMKALADRERTKSMARRKAQGGPSSLTKVLFGVLAVGVLGIVAQVVFGGGETARRLGEAQGERDAQADIARVRFVLHPVGSGDASGVRFAGESWMKALRTRFRVYVVVHAEDAVKERERLEYFRAYNAAMLKHLQEKHGADFLERAAAEPQ